MCKVGQGFFVPINRFPNTKQVIYNKCRDVLEPEKIYFKNRKINDTVIQFLRTDS